MVSSCLLPVIVMMLTSCLRSSNQKPPQPQSLRWLKYTRMKSFCHVIGHSEWRFARTRKKNFSLIIPNEKSSCNRTQCGVFSVFIQKGRIWSLPISSNYGLIVSRMNLDKCRHAFNRGPINTVQLVLGSFIAHSFQFLNFLSKQWMVWYWG